MRALLPLLALLLSACAVGPYASTPRYVLPETRTTAARQLNEALAFGSRNISEVAADELSLTWNERRALSDKRYVLLERELVFSAVRSVTPADRPGEWWEIRVDATGGQLTFEFDDGRTASKAEVALRRLMKPITDEEERELAEKYLRELEGKSVTSKGSGSKGSGPSSVPAEMASKMLHRLTGRDHGKDADAWRKFLEDNYSGGR